MYTFYLGSIIFPITPTSLNIRTNNQNKTVTLMNEGEFNILKSEKLKDITFEVLIPSQKYPFVSYLGGFLPKQYYIEMLSLMKNSKKPVQFMVIRNPKNLASMHYTNIKVSLEEFEVMEDADSLGEDLKISIQLKEYKEKSGLLMQLTGIINGLSQYTTTKSRELTKAIPRNYTVRDGDTLLSIAKKQMGSGSLSTQLQTLNNLPNTVDLSIGQVIRLE